MRPAASDSARTAGWPTARYCSCPDIDAELRQHDAAQRVVGAADARDAEHLAVEILGRGERLLARAIRNGSALSGEMTPFNSIWSRATSCKRRIEGDIRHVAFAGAQRGDGGRRLLHAHELDIDAGLLVVAERLARSSTEFGTSGVSVSVTMSLNGAARAAAAAESGEPKATRDKRVTSRLDPRRLPERDRTRADALHRLVLDEGRLASSTMPSIVT